MTGTSELAIHTAQDVLAKCAANDPWFPQPSEAIALAWAEQFAITNLTRDDLLAGVTSVYATHGSGFKPLPGDIITAARVLRADVSGRAQTRIRDKAEPDEPTPPGWDGWTPEQRVAHYWRNHDQKCGR